VHLHILSYLPFFIPLSLLVAGWYCGREQSHNIPQKAMWIGRSLVLFYVISLAVNYVLFDSWHNNDFVRHTALSQIMLGLLVVMGWVLLTFSRNYMAGQANSSHYYRWFMFILASISLTVTANHLAMFWLGWMSISLSLHKLLTFYPDRPRAILAAHKKFILARIAEFSLLVAFILLYQQYDSVYISELLATVSQQRQMALDLAWQSQFAASLIAFAALIKCAQLPFHGWLIQVVEAPTPVSALLHAGVINLGGYMLLLFAPLVSQSSTAIWLLLIIAGLSTLASALIMTTRISVKVRLAWSTSAQMGLMLLEFALGLYELVLLHLLAHSFYKAFAFLNSGNAVNDDLRLRLSRAIPSALESSQKSIPNWKEWTFAIVISLVCVITIRTLFNYSGAFSTWWLFALALTILILQWRSAEHSPPLLYTLAIGFGLTLLYAELKTIMQLALPLSNLPHLVAFSMADIWAMLLFTLLFVVNALLFFKVDFAPIRRLSVALFAGLYLDEWLTRAVLKIWPVSLPARSKDQHSTALETETRHTQS
jgi:NAD(P)H-quinone oxidoreductase subunit 5